MFFLPLYSNLLIIPQKPLHRTVFFFSLNPLSQNQATCHMTASIFHCVFWIFFNNALSQTKNWWVHILKDVLWCNWIEISLLFSDMCILRSSQQLLPDRNITFSAGFPWHVEHTGVSCSWSAFIILNWSRWRPKSQSLSYMQRSLLFNLRRINGKFCKNT